MWRKLGKIPMSGKPGSRTGNRKCTASGNCGLRLKPHVPSPKFHTSLFVCREEFDEINGDGAEME